MKGELHPSKNRSSDGLRHLVPTFLLMDDSANDRGGGSFSHFYNAGTEYVGFSPIRGGGKIWARGVILSIYFKELAKIGAETGHGEASL